MRGKMDELLTAVLGGVGFTTADLPQPKGDNANRPVRAKGRPSVRPETLLIAGGRGLPLPPSSEVRHALGRVEHFTAGGHRTGSGRARRGCAPGRVPRADASPCVEGVRPSGLSDAVSAATPRPRCLVDRQRLPASAVDASQDPVSLAIWMGPGCRQVEGARLAVLGRSAMMNETRWRRASTIPPRGAVARPEAQEKK